MPILITGPDSATGVRWGMRHPEAALVATDPAVSVLAPMLERLRTDDSLRSRLAAGSAAIALSEFEPRAARSRFVELMRQARAANKPHTLTEPRLPA
jgi:hypothetical protein